MENIDTTVDSLFESVFNLLEHNSNKFKKDVLKRKNNNKGENCMKYFYVDKSGGIHEVPKNAVWTEAYKLEFRAKDGKAITKYVPVMETEVIQQKASGIKIRKYTNSKTGRDHVIPNHLTPVKVCMFQIKHRDGKSFDKVIEVEKLYNNGR